MTDFNLFHVLNGDGQSEPIEQSDSHRALVRHLLGPIFAPAGAPAVCCTCSTVSRKFDGLDDHDCPAGCEGGDSEESPRKVESPRRDDSPRAQWAPSPIPSSWCFPAEMYTDSGLFLPDVEFDDDQECAGDSSESDSSSLSCVTSTSSPASTNEYVVLPTLDKLSLDNDNDLDFVVINRVIEKSESDHAGPGGHRHGDETEGDRDTEHDSECTQTRGLRKRDRSTRDEQRPDEQSSDFVLPSGGDSSCCYADDEGVPLVHHKNFWRSKWSKQRFEPLGPLPTESKRFLQRRKTKTSWGRSVALYMRIRCEHKPWKRQAHIRRGYKVNSRRVWRQMQLEELRVVVNTARTMQMAMHRQVEARALVKAQHQKHTRFRALYRQRARDRRMDAHLTETL